MAFRSKSVSEVLAARFVLINEDQEPSLSTFLRNETEFDSVKKQLEENGIDSVALEELLNGESGRVLDLAETVLRMIEKQICFFKTPERFYQRGVGTKYLQWNCGSHGGKTALSAKNSQNAITLREAFAMELEPCKVCTPPNWCGTCRGEGQKEYRVLGCQNRQRAAGEEAGRS